MATDSTSMRRRDRLQLGFLVGPTALYLLLFFVIPLGIIFVYSFLKAASTANWSGFNLQNYVRAVDPLYLQIFWRSAVLATASTVGCLLLVYPFAYYIARRVGARATCCWSWSAIPF
ncbi:MAG: hypothetical protein R3A10_14475 [Caldilineaceae bacterium]